MSYKLITKDGSAKRGEFTTPHGVIQTPEIGRAHV